METAVTIFVISLGVSLSFLCLMFGYSIAVDAAIRWKKFKKGTGL